MSAQFFIYAVMLISILTSLSTEAIKKLISKENRVNNIIAACCSIVLSLSIGFGYCLYIEQEFTIQVIEIIVAIAFVSLLCALCGYDKVMQTLKQIKEKNNNEIS